MATPLDANTLLRYVKRSHPLHPTVRAAVRTLRGSGEPLFILPQNVYELLECRHTPGIGAGRFRNESVGG